MKYSRKPLAMRGKLLDLFDKFRDSLANLAGDIASQCDRCWSCDRCHTSSRLAMRGQLLKNDLTALEMYVQTLILILEGKDDETVAGVIGEKYPRAAHPTRNFVSHRGDASGGDAPA